MNVDSDAEGPGPIMDDPRRGTWWQVEDVVAHVGKPKSRRYLVQYMGFPALVDEWKSTADVSQVLVDYCESLLREMTDNTGSPMRSRTETRPPPRAAEVVRVTRSGRAALSTQSTSRFPSDP